MIGPVLGVCRAIDIDTFDLPLVILVKFGGIGPSNIHCIVGSSKGPENVKIQRREWVFGRILLKKLFLSVRWRRHGRHMGLENLLKDLFRHFRGIVSLRGVLEHELFLSLSVIFVYIKTLVALDSIGQTVGEGPKKITSHLFVV